MREVVVKAENAGMMFNLNKEKIDNIKEFVIKLLKGKLKFDEFWAVRNVSFELEKGERLGILGSNGAGKSTLLKLVAGVLEPSEGSVLVSGVIAPLLELGAGFDPNYTGKENVFLYGYTLGYSKKFLEEKYDEIIDFAELRSFEDVPIKNYSSGMRARLGFAIACAVEPDILILDEVLSVGDASFRQKSEQRILSMLEKGVTVLFVSHSTAQVRRICSKAIILEKGRVKSFGEVNEICDEYDMLSAKKER